MRRSLLPFCLVFLFIPVFSLGMTANAQAPAAPAPQPAPPAAVVPVTMQLAVQPPTEAQKPAISHDAMPASLLIGVLLATYALVFIGVRAVIKALRDDNEWSMARALSDNEIVEQTDPTDPAKTIKAPLPSSSRLIALLGLIVLMVTFLALGSVMVWTLGRTGQVSGMGDAQGFLWAGLSMFAPYLISQGKEAVKAFGKPGA